MWGYSFGGWLAGLTACCDGRLATVVLTAPRVRMNLPLPNVIFPRRIREILQVERSAWEILDRTPLNLATTQPVIPKQNILLIEALHDLFVGTEGIEGPWQAWGQPEIWRLPHGRVSKALAPGLKARVLRWLAEDAQFHNTE